MIDACPTPDPRLGLVHGLTQTVDCGVRVFAQSGYEALTRPPSPFPAIVTILLTLYVAFIGWGMLSGRGPRLADTPQIAVKIGVILALTASWPLFQALVFRTAFDGAADFVTVLTAPLRQGAGGDLWTQLQAAYDEIVLTATALGAAAGPDPDSLRGGPAAAAEALWAASTAMMASTLGVVLVAKIVAGVLTATGPIFIVLFMLDATRGLFIGWLRALITTAFVPLMAMSGMALLLALVEPRLAAMAAMRAAGTADLSLVAGLAMLIFVFAAAQACLVLAMAVAGLGFGLKRSAEPQAAPATSRETSRETSTSSPEPTRAAAVADAVRRMDIRERETTRDTERRIDSRSETSSGGGRSSDHAGPPRLGSTYRRIRGPVAQPGSSR